MMNQLRIEKVTYKGIPVTIVHPIKSENKTVVFYHGWSSSSDSQISRASLLALHGYTVYLPTAIYHGDRGALENYFEMSSYDLFWDAILKNIEEFPDLIAFIRERGEGIPFLLGHSMGGMSVLGIAAAHPSIVKGVISFNGSGDWELTHLFMQARFSMIKEMREDVKNANPIAHVKEMDKIPFLLLNGETDISVDPRAQEHFFNVLKENQVDAKNITYPRLGHFVTTNMMDEAISWMGEKFK